MNYDECVHSNDEFCHMAGEHIEDIERRDLEREHSDHSRKVGRECGSFYMDFETKKPYPCDCGFVETFMPTKKLTTDEWEDEYKPTDSADGTLAWEFPATMGVPSRHVWSLVDGDNDHTYAIPGYHVVNVFGYAVTEKAWPHGNIEARYDHDDDTEEHDG